MKENSEQSERQKPWVSGERSDEWWYWMKEKNNDARVWDEVRKLFSDV